jgi:hypothetical protein
MVTLAPSRRRTTRLLRKPSLGSSRHRERQAERGVRELARFSPRRSTTRKPTEELAPIGSARTYFDSESWHGGVEALLQRAALIVIAVGKTEGLAWEVAKVTELDIWPRTILIFPPVSAPELSARWDVFVDAATAAGAELTLPVDPKKVLVTRFVGREMVAYVGSRRDEWSYEEALVAAANAIVPVQKLSTSVILDTAADSSRRRIQLELPSVAAAHEAGRTE